MMDARAVARLLAAVAASSLVALASRSTNSADESCLDFCNINHNHAKQMMKEDQATTSRLTKPLTSPAL